MEKRALIGITVYKNEAGREPEHSYYLNEAYSSMVSRAGGLPVLLPYTFDGWDLLDGVLIAGGPDLTEEVAHDAGEPGELSPGVLAARDAFELALFREADARGLPVLGICRGCQLVNCARGGSLVRDLAAAGISEEHRIEPLSIEGLHPVRAEAGSLVERLLAGRTGVCSCHHQAVKTLGQGFRATAWSPAGVIEAIEHENGRILGIQAHPERMDWPEPFRWLVGLAGSGKAR